MDGFELQDELTALAQDPQNYDIPNETDFSSEDPTRLLEAAVEAIANSSGAIADPQVFDVFRSVLKHSSSVPPAVMNKVLDSITSGLNSEMDSTLRDVESGDQTACPAHKAPLEQFAFLIHWFVIVAENVKANDDAGPPLPTQKPRRGRGGKAGGRAAKSAAALMEETWSWESQIPGLFNVISRVIIRTGSYWQRIWTAMTEKEAFISCLVKPAYHVLENEQYMKTQEIKMGTLKVICVSVKHHNQQVLAANTNIIQNLQFYEHLPEVLAECLNILASQYAHTQLGDDVLREIAGKTFNAQDNKGPRNFSRFLVRFSEYAPRSVLKQLSLLLAQLDSEAYPMRIAMVEVIGHIIEELAANSDDDTDAKQTQKQISGLFDLLHERVLDVSSYVRTKVFAVLSKVFDIKAPKFPKQRLTSASLAVDALKDKASTVRKAAVSLLTKLLITHPYGMMHGGMLQSDVWETEYEVVKAQWDKVQGNVGKAVEVQAEEGDEGDSQGEEQESAKDSGESPKKKKKAKRTKQPRDEDDDDTMDVDGDDSDEGALTEDDEDDDDPMSADGEEGVEGSQKKSKSKKSKLKPRKSELDMNALTQEQVALASIETDELTHLRLKKKYYAEAMTFIRQIEEAMDGLEDLFGSTKAEVLETMEFFRVAYEYQLKGAKKGVQNMIHLIWVKDNSSSISEEGKELKGIRQRLLEVYRYLYFDVDPDSDEKAEVNRITKNLIERTFECTLAEITSLEEMMRIMMEEDMIHRDVITKLWQTYGTPKNIPSAQRRGAIIILGMLAVADKSIVEAHIGTMLKVGFGKIGSKDLLLARYTCIALQRLNGSAKKVKGSLKDNTVRYAMDHAIFSVLAKMIEKPCRQRDWFGMAELVINTIYTLGLQPDQWCQRVIKTLTNRVFGPKEGGDEDDGDRVMENASEQGDGDGEGKNGEGKEGSDEELDADGDVTMSQANSTFTQSLKTQNSGKDCVDAFKMSQLIFVVGHVALKQIVFMEIVEREWKRQKDEKLAEEKKEKGDKSSKNKDGEELEQVAGNAEDEIGDRMQAIRHEELLDGENSLLARFAPMIVHICGSPHKYKDSLLKSISINAFSKLLCVSKNFCETHLHLLFRLLDTSKDATVRSNIVIALGDIALSFANIIDENSNEMYKGLSDGVVSVKKNTLMVLTHLILNAMIKVKGQLGEMAKCLEDDDQRIQQLAKLFFKELSTKENAIYNNLQDVISHLSTGEHAVDEEMFRKTLQYIFTFIDKEKQAENIVEKLCQRFRLTEDPRQWRDIAFCLSLLPFKSERSVKKLIEGLQFYRDKLHEKKVYESFLEILNKARSNKSKDKPDTELDEFEKILEEHKNQGEEDHEFESRIKKKTARRGGRKAPARRKAAPRQAAAASDEDE